MSYNDMDFSFEESIMYNQQAPMTILERLSCVKQLIFTRTRLEFRLLWNKIFQKEDEELGWLLNPYRRDRNDNTDATMMSTFNRNYDGSSYQYDFDTVRNGLGRSERVTIYNQRVARGIDRSKPKKEKKSFGETALQIARYMGMGVYMTSTAYPSPLMPIDDSCLYDENYYGPQNVYTMSKIW